MKEIKEGMYVRTNEGYIAKFIHYGKNDGIEGNSYLFDKPIRNIEEYIFSENNFLWDKEIEKYITKASYDIIDLIQKGDYVNGHKVIYVEDLDSLEYLFVNAEGESYYSSIYKDCNKPKTIVTKEQFESMKYEVE